MTEWGGGGTVAEWVGHVRWLNGWGAVAEWVGVVAEWVGHCGRVGGAR